MTRRASALSFCILPIVMASAESTQAGIWYTEPLVGVQADYSTNPTLSQGNRRSTTDAALLVDVPTTYYADAWNLLLEPTFRYSDTSGYSSLVSNYAHLTAAGEFDTEINSVKLTAVAERDSSLYADYNFNGSIGVRQDTALADLKWVRALTERLNFNLDLDYSNVRYGTAAGFESLTNYSYSSGAPSLTWQLNERSALTLSAAFSLYTSLDGSTRSTDTDLELGFNRRLTETWTVTTKAGLSHENNEIELYLGRFLLGTFKSAEDGTIFSVDLTRQGLRLSSTLTASRSLVPSGFAFLSRRDLYQAQSVYPITERWTLSGYVRYRKEQDPQFLVPTLDLKYTDLGLSASWLATEHWTLSGTVSHVAERFGSPNVNVAESAVSLQLTRKFDRIEWH